jgi:hypothetical protein
MDGVTGFVDCRGLKPKEAEDDDDPNVVEPVIGEFEAGAASLLGGVMPNEGCAEPAVELSPVRAEKPLTDPGVLPKPPKAANGLGLSSEADAP